MTQFMNSSMFVIYSKYSIFKNNMNDREADDMILSNGCGQTPTNPHHEETLQIVSQNVLYINISKRCIALKKRGAFWRIAITKLRE